MKHWFLVFMFALFLFSSCSSDDEGGPNVEIVPPRLLAEVAAENDTEIKEFLQTHFYNYEDFANPSANFNNRIKIDTIAGANADKTPLSEFVREATINVSDFEWLLDQDEDDIPHTLYYLSASHSYEELEQERIDCPECFPSVADSVFVRYEGKLLDGSSFDGALNNAVWFDLARLQDLTQGFRGFSEGIPNFKIGDVENIIDNGDGTVTVDDYGVGLIIFPSGLGNFNRVNPDIPQYSPLMFTIDLFTMNQTDHDGDGIPSILEDANQNGFLYDDNTDADTEPATVAFANFQDADDDGDGVSTRDEITNDQGEINLDDLPDDNNDGVPNYLDPDAN
ncbi:FKBP-type peptidyl-prolyl cis-trans isomerase [Flagellimonas myxillae]|uniref:FKBP-type peptidyl-prolyl cis-trans isomerase n=1 Tax=Flagellimonas myxillae TaxID=2942214 RepID=UPI00201FAD0C|nr:FKBP-type peptidyl-prolyl cis-trans isomerase [Muricauda myxillae]MCL6267866.1 FKBP-type peptidyl-prolyl cis-trans isomerase [Muricauda myxillae]